MGERVAAKQVVARSQNAHAGLSVHYRPKQTSYITLA